MEKDFIEAERFYQAKKNAPRNKPIEKITDFEIKLGS